MPDRIRELLGKRAADLTRQELLDIAADAANRDPWDLCGDREHVGAICDLVGTLEAELAEMRDVVNALLEWDAVLAAVDALPSIDPMDPEAAGIGAIMIAAWQDVESALQRFRPIKHQSGAQEDFYAHRLDVCSCGHRRGDHEGAEPCPCMWSRAEGDATDCPCKAFSLAESHDPRGRMPRRANEPGPHDAITVDSALDDDDETSVATDGELLR
jgi:hypothetical protein